MKRSRVVRHLVGAGCLTVAVALSGTAGEVQCFGAQTDQTSAEVGLEGPEGLSLRWTALPGEAYPSRVELSGVSAGTLEALGEWDPASKEWRRFFTVYTPAAREDAAAKVLPMAGTYAIEEDRVLFRPLFALERGMTYIARLVPSELPASDLAGSELTASFQVPALPREPVASVSAVYPASAVLPENLLKFYIHFSHAMGRGDVYSHLHLLRADGSEVDLPFLELDEELWDANQKRITVFIDPGRIKRGLKPREELGPALEAGGSYVLLVEPGLRDGSGLPLREEFRKEFRVGPPDTSPPDPSKWTISRPSAGTKDPIQVHFKESLDHALCLRLLHVRDSKSLRLEGSATLADEESVWSFVPASPWNVGDYSFVVPRILEDLAGNQPGRPFEVDVFDEPKPLEAEDDLAIAFRID